MRCQVILEMLSPYLDGALDPAEQQVVQKHLASCPSCRAEYEELKNCVTLLQELPEIAPPANFRVGLMEKIDKLPSATQIPQRKRWFERVTEVTRTSWYRTAAVAAVMAMTLGLTSLWEKSGNEIIPVDPTKAHDVAVVKQEPDKNQQVSQGHDPSDTSTSTVPAANSNQTEPVSTSGGTKSTPEQVKQTPTTNTASVDSRKFVTENYVPQPSEGMVIRSVVLKVDVQDFEGALNSVGSIIQSHGSSIVVPYAENNGSGTVSIRTSAQKHQSVVAALQRLGEVVSYLPSEKDLSGKHKQAVADLEQLKAQHSELIKKLEAGSDSVLQQQLADISTSINEQIKLIQQIEEQCNYAIINLTIS